MKTKLFFPVTILAVLCICSIAFAQEPPGHEVITLTTYYPAPYGEYNSLSVGDPGNGYLASVDGQLLVEGNVGIGTTSPQGNLDISTNGQITFGNNVVDDDTSGIYWHSGSGYGIYRTAGAWTASTYQQLMIGFDTGIILDAGTGVGTGYDKSYVEVASGKGLMVTSGNVGIGTTSPGATLDVAGTGEINGWLNMTNHRITNVATPTANLDAANKAYVDAQAGGGGFYTRKCSWSGYGTNVNWPSGLVGSCTPPNCASGHTSRGIDCYVTSHAVGLWYGTGLPASWSAAGVCERVCEK